MSLQPKGRLDDPELELLRVTLAERDGIVSLKVLSKKKIRLSQLRRRSALRISVNGTILEPILSSNGCAEDTSDTYSAESIKNESSRPQRLKHSSPTLKCSALRQSR